MPIHCRRCLIKFKSDAQLTEHSRSDVGCKVSNAEPIEGFDKDQERKLRDKKLMRAESEERKWRSVYLILFPDAALGEIPSPCRLQYACT
jgi:hypothetical protein